MNRSELVDRAYDAFSRGTSGETPEGGRSHYVEVPVELTIGRLTGKASDDEFRELHESPFRLFTGEGRTTMVAPSLSILVGQYGMGKTEFVHQLCLRMRAMGHIPVPVNLADCRQAFGTDSYIEGMNESKMVEFLFSHLVPEEADATAFMKDVWSELIPEIYRGRVMLVLDSLEELGLNRQQLLKFMQAMVGVLVPSKVSDPFASRVLVSVRSEYLAAFGLDDADSIIGSEFAQLLTVYFLKLSAFSESRIQSYLERRKKPEVSRKLAELPGLRQVLVRPLFLRIFCDLADRMMARDLRHLQTPTLLIESFIQRASEDARLKVRKAFQWDEEGLSALALHLYNTGGLDIPIEKVRADLVRSSSISVDETWEAIHKCPFLRKHNDKRVRFAHRVFIEYFTAKALAREGAREEGERYSKFDTLVLDVDTRKFLRDLFGEEWYERTKRSYGLDDGVGWDLLPGGLDAHRPELDEIRRELLDYMTEPERVAAEIVRPLIHRFISADQNELHPCYRMYNYEAVAVFLWHHRNEEEDQRLSKHFEPLLKQRLEESNKRLRDGEPLRDHYERLIERILSIGERLRYEKLSTFNTKKILDKIEQPETRARIKHIVAAS